MTTFVTLRIEDDDEAQRLLNDMQQFPGAALLTPVLENTVCATVEVLAPWESMALTVAHSQVKRGIDPEPNVTAVCVMVLARLTGQDGPS